MYLLLFSMDWARLAKSDSKLVLCTYKTLFKNSVVEAMSSLAESIYALILATSASCISVCLSYSVWALSNFLLISSTTSSMASTKSSKGAWAYKCNSARFIMIPPHL